jgi:hypothetical protein
VITLRTGTATFFNAFGIDLSTMIAALSAVSAAPSALRFLVTESFALGVASTLLAELILFLCVMMYLRRAYLLGKVMRVNTCCDTKEE